MPFLAWLLFGGGAYLMGCAVQNKPPKETFLAILKGEDVKTLTWFPAFDWAAAGSAVWQATQSGATAGAGAAAGSAVGGAIGGRASVVAFGKEQLGERYVFGASGPNVWDCSGLTQQAYKTVGVKLPHHAASQQKLGTKVSEAQAQAGDLVFWGVVASHVGIYLGNGMVLHAPHTGDVVKISPVWDKRRVTYRSYL